jgi:uncharacterized metal-binding protein YceD (DUF177 family)
VTPPEWSYRVALDRIGAAPVRYDLAATEAERIALARRFGLIAIDQLEAQFDLHKETDAPVATGQIMAKVTQSCIATGDPVPQSINVPCSIRFVDLHQVATEDLELDTSDHDEMEHDGQAVDLGEAAAQTLVLALDPYPRSAAAAAALKAAGVVGEDEVGNGAFAGLKGLLASR